MLVGLFNFSWSNSFLLSLWFGPCLKNYCAELELSIFSISHGRRSDIDNHLETKKTNPLLRQQSCHLVWHTFSETLSYCYLWTVLQKFWLQPIS